MHPTSANCVFHIYFPMSPLHADKQRKDKLNDPASGPGIAKGRTAEIPASVPASAKAGTPPTVTPTTRSTRSRMATAQPAPGQSEPTQPSPDSTVTPPEHPAPPTTRRTLGTAAGLTAASRTATAPVSQPPPTRITRRTAGSPPAMEDASQSLDRATASPMLPPMTRRYTLAQQPVHLRTFAALSLPRPGLPLQRATKSSFSSCPPPLPLQSKQIKIREYII